ncbi:MAG TPA: xanthine dehydrogenase family protein subunit M [bacterium]|nr:xanthine dehydrogenase family protein subunit M [bacterium]
MTIPFDYRAPATLAEALALLRDHGEEAKPLAGGQSLVPLLTLRLARPAVLVDLHRLDELRAVRREGDALFVGALVRHRALERGDGVLADCPLLQEAAALIGNVRVRTLGTIGGSLAHADPAAEWPAVARALDALVLVRGPAGDRGVPAGDFFVGALVTALRPGELIVGVRLPVLGPGTGYAVEEFSRRAGDFAVVAAVAVVELAPDGTVARARVSLAGVGSIPQRLTETEAALAGRRPDPETLRRAAAHAGAIEPEGDAHASAAYRRHLARVLTARALARAAAVAARRGAA